MQSKQSKQLFISSYPDHAIPATRSNAVGSTAEFMIPRLLDYDQCLVYVEKTRPFGDVDGTTQIAKVIRTPLEIDATGDLIQWYELELVTDSEGDKLNIPQPLVVSVNNIVSNRSMRDIQPRQFYNFATLTNSLDPRTLQPDYEGTEEIQYPLSATSFVIKDSIERPLELTSRSALGSGIYGMYLPDESIIPSLLTDQNQITYRIACPNAYIIQDKEHGESITVASINTNRYLDRIIPALSADNSLDALSLIQMNSIQNLTTLWNIVFYRTEQFITQEWLERVLTSYVIRYISDHSLVDSINGDSIQELPINDIMLGLGYEGILADDVYNNGWNRGCVSYNYSQANIIQGDTARY